MKADTFRKSVAKAYKATEVFKLRQLQEQQSKWRRRETIARNKLVEIRQEIEELAESIALDKYGIKNAPAPAPQPGDYAGIPETTTPSPEDKAQ